MDGLLALAVLGIKQSDGSLLRYARIKSSKFKIWEYHLNFQRAALEAMEKRLDEQPEYRPDYITVRALMLVLQGKKEEAKWEELTIHSLSLGSWPRIVRHHFEPHAVPMTPEVGFESQRRHHWDSWLLSFSLNLGVLRLEFNTGNTSASPSISILNWASCGVPWPCFWYILSRSPRIQRCQSLQQSVQPRLSVSTLRRIVRGSTLTSFF